MKIKIKAKKSLGQNFLINPRIVDRILDAAEIKAGDLVVEIGPGKGILTGGLISRGTKVIAIEKDHRLIENLKQKFPQAEIIESDILKLKIQNLFKNSKLKIQNYKIAANLPYYITSHFIRLILEEWSSPDLAVLMVQREVTERIMAEPPHMNLLALSIQYYAKPEIVAHVSRGNFRPIPKVDSSVIRLMPHVPQMPPNPELFSLLKYAFSRKRKQLAGVLAQKKGKSKEQVKAILRSLDISDRARPENLSLKEWLKLAKSLEK